MEWEKGYGKNSAPRHVEVKRPILLIDDDADLGLMLAEYLAPEGFAVHLAQTAQEGLARVAAGELVLVILDYMLPDESGLQVLRKLRERSRIPVIMLTTRSSVLDRVSGLEAGADDYIPKPFTPIELLARLRSVLRRGQPTRHGTAFLSFRDLIVDTASRTVERGGELISCTAAEFDALHLLVSSAGQVVTRDRLTRHVLGRSLAAGDRGIDNIISALRKKLGPDDQGRERFCAIRNAGYLYRFGPPSSADDA